MTEVDVALTDYAVAIECAVFTCRLARTRYAASEVRWWFVLFFASVALATAAGGTVHGFFAEGGSPGHRVLWPTTLILIGIAAWSATRIGTMMEFAGTPERMINRAAMAGFVAYVVVVLWISSAFLVAIIGYFPALVVLGAAAMMAYRRDKQSAFLAGFLGIGIMVMAAVVQQMQIDISAKYFNHNALYHVLQGIGLYMVFVMARAMCGQQRVSERA